MAGMNIDGVRHAVAEAGNAVDEAVSGLRATAGKVEEARTGLRETTDGTSNDLPVDAGLRLVEAGELCDRLMAVLSEARTKADEYVGMV